MGIWLIFLRKRSVFEPRLPQIHKTGLNRDRRPRSLRISPFRPDLLHWLFRFFDQILTNGDQKVFMAISANDIRKGMVILHEGAPVKVMEFHHHTPGNLRAMVQARLRNLLTGNSFEFRFRSADTLEKIMLEQHKMEYLYSDGSHHHFMNSENYEQVALTEEELGDAAQWLMPGLKIEVEFYNGQPIGVALPASMELTVVTDRAASQRCDRVKFEQARNARKRRHTDGPAVHRRRRKDPRQPDRSPIHGTGQIIRKTAGLRIFTNEHESAERVFVFFRVF